MTDPGFAFTHITKEHIQPLAQLCLAELRRQGMGRALKVLLEITRQFSPVSRINGVFISRDGNSIFSTHSPMIAWCPIICRPSRQRP